MPSTYIPASAQHDRCEWKKAPGCAGARSA